MSGAERSSAARRPGSRAAAEEGVRPWELPCGCKGWLLMGLAKRKGSRSAAVRRKGRKVAVCKGGE